MAVVIGAFSGFVMPAWISAARSKSQEQTLWMPAAFVTLSLLDAAIFVILIAIRSLTVDYSVRFAAVGIPLGILAFVLVRKRRVGSQGAGVRVSSALSLITWWFLITLH